jgi:hypothetical protein
MIDTIEIEHPSTARDDLDPSDGDPLVEKAIKHLMDPKFPLCLTRSVMSLYETGGAGMTNAAAGHVLAYSLNFGPTH